MIRTVRLAILIAIAALLVYSAHAQTWATVANEGDTVVIGSTPATLQFGVLDGTPVSVAGSTPCTTAAGCWDTPLVLTSALVAITVNAATFGGTDPSYGTVKIMQAEETSTAQIFQVTNNGTVAETEQGIAIAPGATETVTVPSLLPVSTVAAIPVDCPSPATFNANPALPAMPPNCAALANEIAVAGDGSTITNLLVATPVIFQYCTGSGTAQICDAPFMFISLPITVGPNAQCGGPPVAGATAPGTLYVVEAAEPNTVDFSDPAGTLQPPLTIPAAPAT